jgi:hypothetical protein
LKGTPSYPGNRIPGSGTHDCRLLTGRVLLCLGRLRTYEQGFFKGSKIWKAESWLGSWRLIPLIPS